MFAGTCKDPQVNRDGPAVAELVADVAAAVGRRAAAVSEDVYEAIVREIPQLDEDKPLLALLRSSVDSNVDTCLQIMQHQTRAAGKLLARPIRAPTGRRRSPPGACALNNPRISVARNVAMWPPSRWLRSPACGS
jgi:hypothetical protein